MQPVDSEREREPTLEADSRVHTLISITSGLLLIDLLRLRSRKQRLFRLILGRSRVRLL